MSKWGSSVIGQLIYLANCPPLQQAQKWRHCNAFARLSLTCGVPLGFPVSIFYVSKKKKKSQTDFGWTIGDQVESSGELHP